MDKDKEILMNIQEAGQLAKEILTAQLIAFTTPRQSGWRTAPTILLEVKVPESVQEWVSRLVASCPPEIKVNLSDYWTMALSDLIHDGLTAKLKRGSW